MRKYFYMQLKRLLRIIIPVLLVTALLFGCLMAVLDIMSGLEEDSDVTAKFKVGVVGTADDLYLQLGLSAMSSMDSSRFSLELVQMQEAEAEQAMRKGDIVAFIVFPEGFMDSAFHGDIKPLKFVCTAGAIGLVSMIKEEFTQMVEIMLIESQKGIYGTWDAIYDNGLGGSSVVNKVSIRYAEFIFVRSNIYKTSEMNSFSGLGMDGYLITGLCIVLFMLICLTFAPMMIRRDYALPRMLCAGRLGVVPQVLCDFGAYLLGLAGIAGVVLLYIVFWMEAVVTAEMLLLALPVLFALGAMSFLMYEMSSDMVAGVLLQFFVILALCFISGCMYPITFFPESMQKLSTFLPTGLARLQVADCILQTPSGEHTFALIGYGCLFLTGSVLIRRLKLARR